MYILISVIFSYVVFSDIRTKFNDPRSVFILALSIFQLIYSISIETVTGDYYLTNDSIIFLSSNQGKFNVFILFLLAICAVRISIIFFPYKRLNIGNLSNKEINFINYSSVITTFLVILSLFTIQDKILNNDVYSISGISIISFFTYCWATSVTYMLSANSPSIKKIVFYLVISILIFVPLFYIGVRQIFFWSLLIFFINIFLHNGRENVRLDLFSLKNFILLLVVAILFSYVLLTRSNVDIDVQKIFVYIFYMLQAEIINTFLSMGTILQNDNLGISYYEYLLNHITIWIPTFIVPEKTNYMPYFLYMNSNGLKPYGTFFIFSDPLLLSRSLLIFFFLFLLYGLFIHKLSRLSFRLPIGVFRKTLVSPSIVFLCIYPLRGSLIGGIKIFLSILLFYIFIYFLLFILARLSFYLKTNR